MTNPDKLADALRVDSERIAESLYEWMIGLMPNGDLLNGAVVCDHGGAINFKKALARQLESTLAASLAAPPAQGEWQPIETAPKEVGKVVMLGNCHGAWAAQYMPVYGSGWRPENPWTSMMLNHEHMRDSGGVLNHAPATHWKPWPAAAPQPAPAPVQAVCNRNCDCVGECKAGVERPAAQPPAPGEAEVCDHAEVNKLVEFFRKEGYMRFGLNGDNMGWSPAETAIRAMREYMQKETAIASQLESRNAD